MAGARRRARCPASAGCAYSARPPPLSTRGRRISAGSGQPRWWPWGSPPPPDTRYRRPGPGRRARSCLHAGPRGRPPHSRTRARRTSPGAGGGGWRGGSCTSQK
ncbi:RPMS1 [human gammaherpesvirus 4]|uniref:RPMS1 n=1 Tax=Epstein-Barr virus (strain GD1) TaxID=10376 RepID=A0A0C7TBJ8_EBVG|nr:RPMS1 [human gammaherpesvirus 4]